MAVFPFLIILFTLKKAVDLLCRLLCRFDLASIRYLLSELANHIISKRSCEAMLVRSLDKVNLFQSWLHLDQGHVINGYEGLQTVQTPVLPHPLQNLRVSVIECE